MTTPQFGIVAEGPTDFLVLQYILAGYFDDRDIDPNPLQPLRDATGTFEDKGGWAQVLEYCRSEQFRGAFERNEQVIIQIDTDVSEAYPSYGVPHRAADGRALTPAELVDAVTLRLVQEIGPAFYEAHRDRILFAVCVHSLECWLLPRYWQDGRRERTENCLKSLNERLVVQEGFTIHAKEERYYRKIAKPYAKPRELRAHWEHNPSLRLFIASLERRFGRGFTPAPQ